MLMMQPKDAALLCLVACAAVSAVAGQETFYDILKKDPKHRMIMTAVDKDTSGSTKAMLQQQLPVTALVPTDAAFIRAALKYKLGTSVSDMNKIMANSCLIQAILKQHILPGVYDTAKLRTIYERPSMLVTKKYDTKTKKTVNVNWPLRFKKDANDNLTVTSAAMDPNTQKPAINGTMEAPFDVKAGNGILHNVNTLMLPTTNLTRLAQISGCQLVV